MKLNWNKNPQALYESWYAYSQNFEFIYHIEYDYDTAKFKSCICLFNSILGSGNGWNSIEAVQNHWQQHEDEINKYLIAGLSKVEEKTY